MVFAAEMRYVFYSGQMTNKTGKSSMICEKFPQKLISSFKGVSMSMQRTARKTSYAGLQRLVFLTVFSAFFTGQLLASYRLPAGVTIGGIAAPVAGHQVAQKIIASGDTEWAFLIYLPPTYDPNGSKLWPTIFLYTPSTFYYSGSGNINNIITGNYDNGACAKYLQDSLKSKYTFISDRFIVITPYVNGDAFKCVGGQPQRLGGLHHYLKTAYKIDPARITLMGLCAGGGAIWNYAESDPTFATCLVPLSCNDNWGSTCNLTLACNLKNIWIRHYADAGDPYVPYASAVAINTALDNCALAPRRDTLITTNTNKHEIWLWANICNTAPVYDWMLTKVGSSSGTAVAPEIAYNEKTLSVLSMETRLSQHDRMDIIGVNGRLLYRLAGNGSTASRLIPNLNPGAYLVRISFGDQTAAQMFQVK
jgi:hypothetical protein